MLRGLTSGTRLARTPVKRKPPALSPWRAIAWGRTALPRSHFTAVAVAQPRGQLGVGWWFLLEVTLSSLKLPSTTKEQQLPSCGTLEAGSGRWLQLFWMLKQLFIALLWVGKKAWAWLSLWSARRNMFHSPNSRGCAGYCGLIKWWDDSAVLPV